MDFCHDAIIIEEIFFYDRCDMEEFNRKKTDTAWQSPTKYFVAACLILFGLYILYISRAVLTLLLTAALLAFIASPVIKLFQNKLKLSKGLSVAITYLLAALFLLTAPVAFLSQGTKAINFFLGLDYIQIAQDSLNWLENSLNTIKILDIPIIDPFVDNVITSMINALQNVQTPDASVEKVPEIDTVIQSLVNAFAVGADIVAGIVGGVISGVLAIIFLILTSIYFSLDGENFLHNLLDKLPPAYKPEYTALATRIRHVWEGFFRGQITLMLTIGTIIWLGGSLLGLPFALFLGVISGLLEILPNLGPTIATIPAIVIALFMGPTYFELNHFIYTLIIVAFYVSVQFLENSFIVPKIMGEALDLHPILILAGVFVGATVWGILGALIAAPVIATIKEILEYLYFKLAWEQPQTYYERPPEEENGLLKQVQTFFHRFMKKKKTSEGKGNPKTVSKKELTEKNPYITTQDKVSSTLNQEHHLQEDINKIKPPEYISQAIPAHQEIVPLNISTQTPKKRDKTGLLALIFLTIASIITGIFFITENKNTDLN